MYREVAAPNLPTKPRPTASSSFLPTSPLIPAGATVATEIISPPPKPTNEPQDIESKDFDELKDYIGKLDDLTVRKWYVYHDEKIYEQIDSSLSIEEKAHQAFELRNEYRTQARELMADQEKRRELDAKHPNKTWEETIADKMNRKGLTREEAIADIYRTAIKSNPKVNRKFNLG